MYKNKFHILRFSQHQRQPGPEGPDGQLRLDGPDRSPEVDPREHRAVRRGPELGHPLRPQHWGGLYPLPHAIASRCSGYDIF